MPGLCRRNVTIWTVESFGGVVGHRQESNVVDHHELGHAGTRHVVSRLFCCE